jgi:hypothetical protein
MTPTDLSRDDVRAGLKRWIDTWRVTGPLLEQERAERLARMTDEEARELTRDLFALWRPSALDDMGAELVTQQRWFVAAARIAGRR